MTIDEKELREAFEAVVADGTEIQVVGKKISRLGLVGIVLADGQNVLELEPDEQRAILLGLQQAAKDAVPEHLDPAKNSMIRIPD